MGLKKAQTASASHTPGPWVAQYFNRVDSMGGDQVAVLNSGVGQREVAGNAHLIAAAPEMLEALKKVLAIARFNKPESIDWGLLGADLEALIAKATGGAK